MACGVAHVADGALWLFDLANISKRPDNATAPHSKWAYLLSNPCDDDPQPCRPAACANDDPQRCTPLNNASAAYPTRGTAVQWRAHAATPAFPAPTPAQRCVDEQSGKEVPCTPVCNALAPTGTSARWSLRGWSPLFYNRGTLRLEYAAQQPSSYWDADAELRQCDARNPRKLTIDFLCDQNATSPRLLPPTDGAAQCNVSLVVKTNATCFSFSWRAGPWSPCHADEAGDGRIVRTRTVQCRELLNRTNAPGDCDLDKKPSLADFSSCAQPPPPDAGLTGGALALLLIGVILLVGAVGVGAHTVVAQHHASIQRRRLLAMTLQSQVFDEVEASGGASGGTYYMPAADKDDANDGL